MPSLGADPVRADLGLRDLGGVCAMTVRINPCFGCPVRHDCVQREEWRQKLIGLGLRSATFNCDRLSTAMRPGRRIAVKVPNIVVEGRNYDYEERRYGDIELNATITDFDAVRGFTCTIDPGQQDDDTPGLQDPERARFQKRRRHSRLARFLDEPDAPICEGGNVIRDGKCDTSAGRGCNCGRDTGGAF